MNGLVGLCIVYKNQNYGSILQSYATLLEMKKINVPYEIIQYERKKNLNFFLTAFPRLILPDMRYGKIRSLKRKLEKTRNHTFAQNDEVRAKAFARFREEHFNNFAPVVRTYHELCTCANKYDTVLVGSDQLWLPSGLDTNFYNLLFVSDNINKIAYAASFGVSEVPNHQKEKTVMYLSKIKYISVREHTGQKLIRDLTGRDVPVIVDPTLVIPKKMWDESIPYMRKIDEDYIFCYFLGNNLEHREEARKLSQKTGLKIVTLRHMDEFIQSDEEFGDYAPYDVGPAEFVNLIRHASFVCTDSFHGSVFSIINHKQFVSFNRYVESSKNSRNSRLDSLFDQLALNRRFKGDIISDMFEEIDYETVDINLQHLRNFAENYLLHSLR